MFVQIKQQYFFVFEYVFGEGVGFIYFVLVVNWVVGVKIMCGIDVEFFFVVVVQYYVDGVDLEVVMDFFCYFVDQFVDIQL